MSNKNIFIVGLFIILSCGYFFVPGKIIAQEPQSVQMSVQVLPALTAKPQGKVLGASYNTKPSLVASWWQKFKAFFFRLF